MTLKLEDIAELPKPGLLGRQVLRGASGNGGSRATSRRQFIRGAAVVGTAVSISALGLLPPARPAGAEHGAWQEWPQCSGLGSWVTDDDCNGCNQGSRYGCCYTNGYHMSAATNCHCKHRPNQCKDGIYDLWYWQTGQCCWIGCNSCVKNRKWRCSDGYYRSSCSGTSWIKSICRYVTVSGTGCPPCPC
jgi:hypothetical protein